LSNGHAFEPKQKHGRLDFLLHCTLAAVHCIVIAPVCGWVCVFVGLLPQ